MSFSICIIWPCSAAISRHWKDTCPEMQFDGTDCNIVSLYHWQSAIAASRLQIEEPFCQSIMGRNYFDWTLRVQNAQFWWQFFIKFKRDTTQSGCECGWGWEWWWGWVWGWECSTIMPIGTPGCNMCHVRNLFQTELNRTKTMQIELSPVGCTIQNNLLALR